MVLEDYSIYWAPIQYEEKPIVKKRPVVLIDNKVFLFFEITSKIERKDGYIIRDWKKSNLPKPSLVRFDRWFNLSEDDLGTKIGKLTRKDIKGMEDALIEYKMGQALKN